MIKPVIFGIKGKEVTLEDQEFFKKINPLGFAIFRKNITNKSQLKKLCETLNELVGRENIPIYIDQEGGKVIRLDTSEWRAPPAPLELAKFGYTNCENALKDTSQLIFLNAQLVALEMLECNINTNCYPVADLLFDNAHHITGTRSFAPCPYIVSTLVEAASQGMLSIGVQPIIKHAMGQGRAYQDSHIALPTITATLETLRKTDFSVFANAKSSRWAMMAHIKYEFLDAGEVSTFSKKTIEYFRNELNFKGLLISDCITMKALGTSYHTSARKAIEAGQDIIFFGGSDYTILNKIASNVPNLREEKINEINQSYKFNINNSIKSYAEILQEYNFLFNKLNTKFNKLNEGEFSINLKLINKILASDLDRSSPVYNA